MQLLFCPMVILMISRHDGRLLDAHRPLHMAWDAQPHHPGSCLLSLGNTRVLATVTMTPGVPRFLKGSGTGWLTAEYGMLPSATHKRGAREAALGKQSGRTQEIQRMIGRCVRTCIDLKRLGEHTITIDCDVLRADGGTRTTAITAASQALRQALNTWLRNKTLRHDPWRHHVAAVSVGLVGDQICLDLDYDEDAKAQTDMNLVLCEHGNVVEIQSAAEGKPFSPTHLPDMLALGQKGIQQLLDTLRTDAESHARL